VRGNYPKGIQKKNIIYLCENWLGGYEC
jgi:hypothetical protein